MCRMRSILPLVLLVIPGLWTRTARADSGCGDSDLFTIDNRDGSGLRMVSLNAAYKGVFAEGVDVINTFTATVDWAGKTPSKVVFQLNGSNSDVATAGTTAQKTYNMGDDLLYSRSGAKNELRAWAVAADGSVSQPLKIDLWGLALPTWAISQESKKGPINWRIEPLTGKIAFYGEVEVPGFDGTLYISEIIPEVGGKWGVKSDPLNFIWEVAAQPRIGDGAGLTGSFELGGKWGTSILCGKKTPAGNKFLANITGAGEFYPQFKMTDVSAELAGSLKFLLPRAPLLCQWSGCCSIAYCPYFQASIKTDVLGTVGMEEGEPSLVAGLKFKNAELNIGVTVAGTVGAGTEGGIYYIAGTIGGKPYIILQFPGDVDSSCFNQYIKEIGFELQAKYIVESLGYKKESEWTFTILRCPDASKAYVMAMPSSGGQVVPVEREYLNASEGYCVFPSKKRSAAFAQVSGLPEPITNVGTGPMPSVAATNNAGLLLFVYDDENKPTGKHQEIYWARWNGSQWTEHAPLTNNQQPDLYPTAAIDAAGKEIAVWVRAPEPTGAETGPRDILPGLEIMFSVYDAGGGVWSAAQAVTSNTQVDTLPWFEKMPSGSIRVCWISSATNAIPVWYDEEIAPLLDVMAADWNGSTFGTPYAVATGLQAVSPPSTTRTATHEFLTYLKDVDNNSGTADDREVMVRSRLIGGAWGEDQQLTSDTVSDTGAQVAVDQTGIPTLVWVKRLVPVILPDSTETHVDQLWFSRWNGTTWDAPSKAFEADGIAEPKLIRNEAGRIVLFWVAASKEFSDMYYSALDAVLGQWSKPQQITHDQGAETMLSLTESGGNILAAYVKRRIDLTDPSGVPQIGLSDLYLLEHVPSRDLFVSAQDISFDPAAPVRGQNAAICANIHLAGDFVAQDVLVQFYDGDPAAAGTLIGSQTIEVMLPGESNPACATWAVPNDELAHEIYVVVDPDNTITETDETVNNKAHAGTFGPDLNIRGPYYLGCPNADTVLVGFTVRNSGSAVAAASVCEARKDSGTGDLLFSESIPSLAAGESASVQFSWNVSALAAGRYAVAVIADSSGLVMESDEANNTSIAEIPVQADLQIEPWSIVADAQQIRLLVKNIGCKPSAATTLRVKSGVNTLREVSLAAVAPSGESDTTITGVGASPCDNLTVTANPDSDGSDEATLLNNTVQVNISGAGISISQQPSSQTVSSGTDAQFQVNAAGDGTLEYQWQKDGVNLTNGEHIAGANTNTLSITIAVPADAGNYACVITSGCGSIVSETATLTVISCNTPRMDANGDLHVDAIDFDVFSACYNGPTNKVGGDCLCMDANGDQYVDAIDFDAFSACYNGPVNPPGCQ